LSVSFRLKIPVRYRPACDQPVGNRLDDLHDPVPHIVLLPHPHQTEIGQLLHIFGDRAAIALVLLTVSVLT
jgi:hypothetical protein